MAYVLHVASAEQREVKHEEPISPSLKTQHGDFNVHKFVSELDEVGAGMITSSYIHRLIEQPLGKEIRCEPEPERHDRGLYRLVRSETAFHFIRC